MKQEITFWMLKDLYRQALKKKFVSFFAGDYELLVAYAKYLIQYLESIDGMADDTVLNFQEIIGGQK